MNWLSQIFGFFKSFQFWIVIAPWEAGLRVRLGKSADVLEPGPHVRLPFIDRMFVQSTRLRTISDSGQTMTTKDGHIVTLCVALNYSIADIKRLYLAASNPESTLLHQVQGLVAQFISITRREDLTPAAIEADVLDKMPATDWGLKDVRLMVTSFAFVKVFRIMSNDYRSLSPANELEHVGVQ
jgi:hypothetical protein